MPPLLPSTSAGKRSYTYITRHHRIRMPSMSRRTKYLARAAYCGYKIFQGVRAACGDVTALAELGAEAVGWVALQTAGELTLLAVAEETVEGMSELTVEQVYRPFTLWELFVATFQGPYISCIKAVEGWSSAVFCVRYHERSMKYFEMDQDKLLESAYA